MKPVFSIPRFLVIASVILVLSACDQDKNSFRSLNLTTAGSTDTQNTVKTKVMVVGDINSPQLANYLESKDFEVTDVPYLHNEASDLDMQGDFVVWSDDRNGNNDIYAYQISKNKEFPVTTAPGKQISPKVYGNYIVWEDYRSGNADIYAYRIPDESEEIEGGEFIVAKQPGKQSVPQIEGDYIVWQDERNGQADIYGYQLSTGQEFAISLQEGDQWTPQISGDYVVWQSYLNGFSDIYGYRFSTDTQFPISTAVGSQFQPIISAPYVVWLDNAGGDDNIYAYDLVNEETITVTTAAGQQWRPQADGDYVVWQDYRDGNHDIYAFRFSTRTELLISADPGQQLYPVIAGDIIAWQDSRNGNYDIYAYQLSTATETRLTTHDSPQTRPVVTGEYIGWLDAKRGVVDVILRKGISGTDMLATNTWYTPAGVVDEISGYPVKDQDVVVLGSDVVSDEVMLAVFDAANTANVPMLGLGGTGVSLASTLASAGRYGIQITKNSGCSPMKIYPDSNLNEDHALAEGITLATTLELEQELAVTKDELAITTDASAIGSPTSWNVWAKLHTHMCSPEQPAIVEFKTENQTRVILDGSANVADKYRYWTTTRWQLFKNEIGYLAP